MNLGANINADKSTSIPYTLQAIGLPECNNLRVDFACKDTFINKDYWIRINNILHVSKGRFDNIMIHCGYLDGYSKEEYEKFFIYIGKLTDLIVKKRMQKQVILEIWNNLNLENGYWAKDCGVPEFQNMWNQIKPAVYNAQEQGIRIAGFSFTLKHKSSYEWMHDIKAIIQELDILTVQSYPEKEGEFKNHMDRLAPFMVSEEIIKSVHITEIGAMADEGVEGEEERQLCLYRGFMPEVERYVPDIPVYLYHLGDTGLDSKGRKDSWWLMRIEEDEVKDLDNDFLIRKDGIKERPTLRYLKEKYTQAQLDADKPERMECCRPKKWWLKILCSLRRKFRK